MRTFALLVICVMALLARSALADQVIEECRVIRAAQEGVPTPVRSYMQEHRNGAVRACTQVDFGTKTYYGLAPIIRVDDVCSFAQTQINPEIPKAPAELRFMARAKGICPRHESEQYIPVHKLSEKDFAAIMDLLHQLSASDDAFSSALTRLPAEQRNSSDLAELEKFVKHAGYVPVVRMAQMESFLGLRSSFDVEVNAPRDKSRFYVFRIQKLFGHWKIVEFGSGNA